MPRTCNWNVENAQLECQTHCHCQTLSPAVREKNGLDYERKSYISEAECTDVIFCANLLVSRNDSSVLTFPLLCLHVRVTPSGHGDSRAYQ